MERRTVLRKQAVKRRKRANLKNSRRAVVGFGAIFVKLSCLLAALVLLSFLFLSLYQYLLASPHLTLERVVLTGAEGELKRALLKTSQFETGTSLLALNMNELKERLEKHPWVRSVYLKKRFPNTLLIEVKKENPSAVVAMGKLYYMNRCGKIFKELDQIDDVDYPVVTGVSMSQPDREFKLELAAQVLGVLESEQGLWSLKELCEVHVKKNGSVYLYFRSLPAVIKLRGGELGEKMQILKRVVEHLERTGHIHLASGINLDYRDGAVVSFKSS